jgi:hypothetical protein
VSRPDEHDAGSGAPDRFARSMAIDYEKWHDGIGYDLAALRAAAPDERAAIERMLLDHAPRGWRDVEALAALATPRARAALRAWMSDGSTEVRLAIARHAPELVDERQRVASLVRALETAEFYGGLTQALDEAAGLHPPEVVAALLRGARERDGEAAVHFAALLLFLHGKADAPFDMAQRPFLLRFNTAEPDDRAAAFAELCRRIGVEPAAPAARRAGRRRAAAR